MVKKAVDLKKEVWKPIVGYEGWYGVSNFGNIRREINGTSTYFGKILKPSKNGWGYLQVVLCKNSIMKTFRVHKLVINSFIGKCPIDKEINHKDGNKLNNNISNLEYITPSENMLHAYRNNLRKPIKGMKGINHPLAKLTDKDVIDIRNIYSNGNISQARIGKKYKIGQQNVWCIINKKSWKHLK